MKCHQVDESQRHYAEFKKPASTSCIQYDPIYITFLKKQNHSDEEQISDCHELGMEEG